MLAVSLPHSQRTKAALDNSQLVTWVHRLRQNEWGVAKIWIFGFQVIDDTIYPGWVLLCERDGFEPVYLVLTDGASKALVLNSYTSVTVATASNLPSKLKHLATLQAAGKFRPYGSFHKRTLDRIKRLENSILTWESPLSAETTKRQLSALRVLYTPFAVSSTNGRK